MKSSGFSITEPGKAWVLVDEGNPFLETQCLSIVEAMEFPAHLHRVSIPSFWRYVPLNFIPNFFGKVYSSPTSLTPPWPSLVICGGRISLKLGTYLKKKYNVFTVAVGRTGSSFNKIILESHRPEEMGKNIMTFGPLHRIQQDSLLHARKAFYRKIDHLPKPRVSLFIEEHENLEALIEILIGLHKKSPFSLMVYGDKLSEEDRNRLERGFQKIPYFLWCGQEEDPYLGFLAHSDAIIMSYPSSLMLAEATAVGKPLFVYSSHRLDSYVQALMQNGYASRLTHESLLFSRSLLAPLQESQRVGEMLKGAYLEAFPSSLLNLS
ncbi:MAG: mitochondrial fission ELM1 family protein [Proteobacteria bacterium]|nr:mitochondrial fission ELM1 family protein [Pseudomonadota bacterium]